MINYSEFHDGALDGFRLGENAIDVFLRTEGGKRFVARIAGLRALSASGFRSGNIIFEVLSRDHSEITADDIMQLYELAENPGKANQVERLLADVHGLKLHLFEINPSYGGSCLALGDSVELVPQEDSSMVSG
jgi:hypothetical protein